MEFMKDLRGRLANSQVAIHIDAFGFGARHKIGTTHVEWNNLTIRMSMLRFTRRTNGFWRMLP